MRNFTKLLLGAVGLTGVFTTTAALADDAPDFQATAAVAMQSDYRFRGVSQNSREFAPQGTVNITAPEGFYVGTWASKINWGGNNPSYELDIYGGKHFDLDGTDLNVEAYYYSYPDYNAHGGPAASYYETIVQLTHAFGPLTLTATGTNSPEWSLHGGTGWYASGLASYALTDWLSVSGTIGHQWVEAAPSDYTHFDIGLTATWHNFVLDVRYAGTDIGAANCGFWIGTGAPSCGGGPVATLTYNITDLFHW
ncbi:MAG TPA: TorF family putative porin [Rhizomicrobium sp.]|jgi:uncharacterized protein (TIGR02001 family)|nr:TorF family putative porin [Rhizomicrobium sp.]